MARVKRPAGICEPCAPCPVCGATLFVVKRKRGKGRECLCCKTRLFSNVDLPAASGVGGYARTGLAVIASQRAT